MTRASFFFFFFMRAVPLKIIFLCFLSQFILTENKLIFHHDTLFLQRIALFFFYYFLIQSI